MEGGGSAPRGAPWVVVAGDFVTTGGMDAANHALALHLARSGRETHLVAHRVADDLRAVPGVVVHRVPRPLGSHLLGFPLLARGGRTAAPRGAAHVVANGGNTPAGTVCWLHYVHAAYRPEIAGRPLRRAVDALARRWALRDERAAARGARVVIANSELTARHAVELLGADPARVRVVYYGTDPARFRPVADEERREARARLHLPGDAPALAFVGALGDRRKGFDTLFDAVSFLRSRGEWDARLLVVGTGGELERWKSRAEERKLGDSIRFLGFQPDVRKVLAACDALVSPTRYEAYGLAVHEALCLGLPAIVSRDAGVAERITPPLRELLVGDPDDAGEVAERLLAWRARVDEHRAAALALSEALRGWTWGHMAARMMDIVEEQG